MIRMTIICSIFLVISSLLNCYKNEIPINKNNEYLDGESLISDFYMVRTKVFCDATISPDTIYPISNRGFYLGLCQLPKKFGFKVNCSNNVYTLGFTLGDGYKCTIFDTLIYLNSKEADISINIDTSYFSNCDDIDTYHPSEIIITDENGQKYKKNFLLLYNAYIINMVWWDMLRSPRYLGSDTAYSHFGSPYVRFDVDSTLIITVEVSGHKPILEPDKFFVSYVNDNLDTIIVPFDSSGDSIPINGYYSIYQKDSVIALNWNPTYEQLSNIYWPPEEYDQSIWSDIEGLKFFAITRETDPDQDGDGVADLIVYMEGIYDIPLNRSEKFRHPINKIRGDKWFFINNK